LNENPITRKKELESRRLEDEKIREEDSDVVRQEAAKIDQEFAAGIKAPKTNILSSLNVAQQLFDGDVREKVLVILSDMIEDSDRYNFERLRLTKQEEQKILAEQRERGELPDLRGVLVCVAGANAPTTERFKDVEGFWLLYLTATGADANDSRYGHWLMNCSKPEESNTGPMSRDASRGNRGTAKVASSSRTPCYVHFGLGSDRTAVLVVQGTPSREVSDTEDETWFYGSSYVKFSSAGKVASFFNGGNLRICR
jgi:hypothetical protein